MGTNECSQSASKSSWDSQDVNMVLKMAHFHKSSRPQWVKQTISGRSATRLFVLHLRVGILTVITPYDDMDTHQYYIIIIIVERMIYKLYHAFLWMDT